MKSPIRQEAPLIGWPSVPLLALWFLSPTLAAKGATKTSPTFGDHLSPLRFFKVLGQKESLPR